MRSRLCLLALAMLLVAAAPFEPPHSGTRTVYRHAALIDGTGAPLKADMAVITDGERIVEVVPNHALTTAQLNGQANPKLVTDLLKQKLG